MNREDIGISAISVAELEFGIAASKKQSDNAKRLERFLLDFEVMDFLNAAHALALNAILVTNTIREFERVSGLPVDAWTLHPHP